MITSKGAGDIVKIIKKCNNLNNLNLGICTIIIIESNNINYKGIKIIAEALRTNKTLTTLNLSIGETK